MDKGAPFDHEITSTLVGAEDGRLSQREQAATTWLSYLDSVITCAEAIAKTATINGDDAWLLAACLFARSISTARAVVRLIGLDHVVEARMLARSIFENEFYLYRLARDDGSAFAREMQADEAYHHRGLGKAIEAGGEGRSSVQEIINWSLQKSPNAKPLTPRAAISGSEIRDAYVFYKQLSFDAGHPSITALKRHFIESTGNEGLSLKPQIKDGEVMDTAFLASMALLGGCIAANAFGGTTGGEGLEGLVAEYNEIAARPLPA